MIPEQKLDELLSWLEEMRIPNISDADKVRNDKLALVRNKAMKLFKPEQDELRDAIHRLATYLELHNTRLEALEKKVG